MIGFANYNIEAWSRDGLVEAGRGAPTIAVSRSPRKEMPWPVRIAIGALAFATMTVASARSVEAEVPRVSATVLLTVEPGAADDDLVLPGFWERQLRILQTAPRVDDDGDVSDVPF